MINTKNVIIFNNSNKTRIDKFLQFNYDFLSRNIIQKLIKNNNITVNNANVKCNYILRIKDVINIKPLYDNINTERNIVLNRNIKINIIYEDDDILIINKESGIVVHPANGNWDNTLLNGISYYLSNNNNNKPYLVHRIDKDTSGLIIIAKNIESANYISNQFYNKTVIRNYLGIILGNIYPEKGYVDGYIGKLNCKSNMFFSKKNINDKLKWSKTYYSVIRKCNIISLVQFNLITGRTHQIRLHMHYRNNPILGDTIYKKK
ncbi:MAG: RluA family pseudouridine synthase, partial [Bacteroides sp.]